MTRPSTAIRRPLFSYFGGKFRAAAKYPAPKHAILVEPFAGAAGYASLYPDRHVALFDLDEAIVGIWSYLIHASGAEIRALPMIGHDQSVDDFAIPQEARWLIGFWLNAAPAAPCKKPSAWMKQTGPGQKRHHARGAFWSPENRDRIAAEVEKIRHWKVFQASFAQIPNGDATWFVDPPYQKAGKSYRHSSKAIDFVALGEWCKERDGQVMVCENDGATWLDFRHFQDQKAMSGVGRSGVSKEVIWTKGCE